MSLPILSEDKLKTDPISYDKNTLISKCCTFITCVEFTNPVPYVFNTECLIKDFIAVISRYSLPGISHVYYDLFRNIRLLLNGCSFLPYAILGDCINQEVHSTSEG